MRRMWGAVALLALTGMAQSAAADDKVTLGTDWKAEAEHGGYYQALATGLYKKHGLDVTIEAGGPQLNHAQLLAAGRITFDEEPDSFGPLNFAHENIPMVAVAALFQKDPKVLIAHPGVGNDSLAALKGKPIMISSDTRVGVWHFLKARFGYSDSQIRPYTFNVAPFLVDKNAVQQGYVTSEPLLIEQQGIKPVVMLLADNGYASYASVIETSQKLVHDNPDLVQRFVDATVEGWHSYLYGDPTPANTLIKKDNPEMTDALIAYGRSQLQARGIVDSGDTKTLGIGAMTDARWKDFFDLMSSQGVYPTDLDWRKAYTLQFVDKKHGLDARK
jgi:NitT/TauT family transport system substrate-binding protein